MTGASHHPLARRPACRTLGNDGIHGMARSSRAAANRVWSRAVFVPLEGGAAKRRGVYAPHTQESSSLSNILGHSKTEEDRRNLEMDERDESKEHGCIRNFRGRRWQAGMSAPHCVIPPKLGAVLRQPSDSCQVTDNVRCRTLSQVLRYVRLMQCVRYLPPESDILWMCLSGHQNVPDSHWRGLIQERSGGMSLALKQRKETAVMRPQRVGGFSFPRGYETLSVLTCGSAPKRQ